MAEVEKVARYAMPFIKNIKYLMTQKKPQTKNLDAKTGGEFQGSEFPLGATEEELRQITGEETKDKMSDVSTILFSFSFSCYF
jgi:hypothetical protein